MRQAIVGIVLAGLLTGAGWGQVVTTAVPSQEPRPQSVPDVEVPPELAQRGVQGAPVLRGMVQTDGTITDIEVVETSRSPELDRFAKDFLTRVRFEPAVIDGVRVVAPYENTIWLYKDHAVTLHKKGCADLNVDVAYFRTTFPELPIKDMTLARLSLGTYTLTYTGSKDVAWIKRAGAAFEKTVAWCASHPGDRFLESFAKMAKP